MKHLLLAVIAAAAAVTLSACQSTSDNDGLTAHTITTSDGDRTYLTYIPSDLSSGLRPVVLLFHGHGGSAAGAVEVNGRNPSSRWLDVADREGLVLVVPDGVEGSGGRSGWNDCRSDAATNPVADDVAFVEQILADVAERTPIDRAAIFATGLSNGGHFSLRLGIERPDLVSGVAAVAAAMPGNSECDDPTEQLPVLFINGTEDPLLPFGGGEMAANRGLVLSATESVAVWADLANARPEPELTPFADIDPHDGSTVTRTDHSGDTSVVLYTVQGGGHTEPSLVDQHRAAWTSVVGPQNRDIEMVDEIWAFWQET